MELAADLGAEQRGVRKVRVGVGVWGLGLGERTWWPSSVACATLGLGLGFGFGLG